MVKNMVDCESELRKLLSRFDTLCGIVRATWYEWRQAAIEFARPGVKPIDIVLRAWEIVGHDTAKVYYNMLDKTKPTFIEDIGKCIVFSSQAMGEDAKIVKGENPNEIYVQWDKCPWSEFARRYGVPMEEDVKGCDKWFETIIKDINDLFGVNVKWETLKAIPRGEGMCLRRIWMEK